MMPKVPPEIEDYILSILYSSEDISPSRLHGDLFAPTDLWGHAGQTKQIGTEYSNYHQRLLDRGTRAQSLQSLWSCSLVCRYWLFESQRLLFYWVMIYDAHAFDKLCVLLADPGKAHLVSSIHHISFIYPAPHEKLEEILPRLAALQLPNLHTLDLIARNSGSAVPREIPFSFNFSLLQCTSKMTNIRHLHLGNLSFNNSDTLQQLVNGFQNVRRFSYSTLKCGSEEFGDFRYYRRARDRTIRDMHTHTSDTLPLRGFQCAGPLDMMPTNHDMVPVLTPHVQGFLEDILEILSDNLIKYSWQMDSGTQQWQLECYSSMLAMSPSISVKFVDLGLPPEHFISFDERHLVSIRAEITAPHFVSGDWLRHLDELLVQFGNLETLELDFGAREFSGLLYQNLSGLGQLYAEYLPLTRRRCRLELSVQGSDISWEDLFRPEKGIRDVTDYRDLGRGWISEGSHEYSMEWLSSLTSVESLTNSVIIPILCGLLPKDAFPKKRSNEATFLLNTVQRLLEEPYITESFDAHGLLTHKRPLLKRLLMRLSRETGSLPDVTFLSGIHGGQHPVTGGSFGDIYRGKLNGMDIALKRLRIFANTTPKEIEKLNADFCVEAVVWRHLKHVNVLPFLGVDLQTFKPHLCMVSPWMQNGNVMTCRSRIPDPNDSETALQIATWIVEVARGLEYLHSEGVIHADLRGANILVDSDKHVRLTDFGLSKYIGAGPATCTVSHGAARWQPVDVLQEISHPSCASDVYSFGCVCLELCTGQIPFASFPTEWKFMAALHSGSRLEIPPSEKSTPKLQELFKDIVVQCWDDDSTKRPTMVAVLDYLEDWHQNR